jgi:hypothetical protein
VGPFTYQNNAEYRYCSAVIKRLDTMQLINKLLENSKLLEKIVKCVSFVLRCLNKSSKKSAGQDLVQVSK